MLINPIALQAAPAAIDAAKNAVVQILSTPLISPSDMMALMAAIQTLWHDFMNFLLLLLKPVVQLLTTLVS